MRTVPPSRTTTLFTMSMPTPRPEIVGGRGSRAEAGLEDELEQLQRRPAFHLRCGRQSAANGRLAQRAGVDAAPVVPHGDEDPIALLLGRDEELSGRRLAALDPFGGRFEAVVEGVADHVNQRLGNLFDDFLVELRLAAADRQLDFLVEGTAPDRAPIAETRRRPWKAAAS